jgi:hypothetical protein
MSCSHPAWRDVRIDSKKQFLSVRPALDDRPTDDLLVHARSRQGGVHWYGTLSLREREYYLSAQMSDVFMSRSRTNDQGRTVEPPSGTFTTLTSCDVCKIWRFAKRSSKRQNVHEHHSLILVYRPTPPRITCSVPFTCSRVSLEDMFRVGREG